MFPLEHDFDVDDYDVDGANIAKGIANGMFTVRERAFLRLLVKEGEADKLRQFTGYFEDKPSSVSQTEIDAYWARVKVR